MFLCFCYNLDCVLISRLLNVYVIDEEIKCRFVIFFIYFIFFKIGMFNLFYRVFIFCLILWEIELEVLFDIRIDS